jgi:hypothetical protein
MVTAIVVLVFILLGADALYSRWRAAASHRGRCGMDMPLKN